MTSFRTRILTAAFVAAGLVATAVPASATLTVSKWMVFAVDNQGAVGHGSHFDRGTARNFALSYCGKPGCRVIATTTSRCHALAHSFNNGYWVGVGDAPSLAGAMGHALNFCARNAPASSCKIAYKFCN